nr:RagB/SusD family nutrient uptake outer membrane protein [Bacteroidota bacterium]
ETTASGTLGRELYLFDADPRNTGDLLGKNGIGLDNNSFYSTAQWNGSYRCIKNANLLIEAASNTSSVTAAERGGYTGFAKTIIAYELIQMAKSYGQARVDVADEENLGPILGEAEVLAAVRTMLDDANTDLNGSSFLFGLSDGFAGFDSANGFREFNRAVAGMAAVYAGDGTGALAALNNSYFSLNGDLTNGPKHVFGTGGNDAQNGLFKVPSPDGGDTNIGDNIIVHPDWVNDAEAGDTRVSSKSSATPDPTAQLDDLLAEYETRLYQDALSPVDILRNEELVLLYAEASILANSAGNAITAINVIRNSAGLSDYAGGSSTAELTAEVVHQRRYSLWGENHRMYDLRRNGLTGTLAPNEPRPGDQIFDRLPVPLAEGN